MVYFTNGPEETEALAEAFASKLRPGQILAYEGDLGAGKTAFTRDWPGAWGSRSP